MSERLFEELGELERERQSEVQEDSLPLSPELKAKLAAQALSAVRTPAVKVLRPTRWIPVAAAVLAVAAGALLFWAPGSALPVYELTIEGGERSHRSGEPDLSNSVLKISEGSVLTVELRPEEPVAGKVVAAAYLYSADSLQVWESSFQTSPEGALRSELTARTAEVKALQSGSTLLVVVASDVLPPLEELEAELRDGRTRRAMHIFRRALEPAPETR